MQTYEAENGLYSYDSTTHHKTRKHRRGLVSKIFHHNGKRRHSFSADTPTTGIVILKPSGDFNSQGQWIPNGKAFVLSPYSKEYKEAIEGKAGPLAPTPTPNTFILSKELCLAPRTKQSFMGAADIMDAPLIDISDALSPPIPAKHDHEQVYIPTADNWYEDPFFSEIRGTNTSFASQSRAAPSATTTDQAWLQRLADAGLDTALLPSNLATTAPLRPSQPALAPIPEQRPVVMQPQQLTTAPMTRPATIMPSSYVATPFHNVAAPISVAVPSTVSAYQRPTQRPASASAAHAYTTMMPTSAEEEERQFQEAMRLSAVTSTIPTAAANIPASRPVYNLFEESKQATIPAPTPVTSLPALKVSSRPAPQVLAPPPALVLPSTAGVVPKARPALSSISEAAPAIAPVPISSSEISSHAGKTMLPSRIPSFQTRSSPVVTLAPAGIPVAAVPKTPTHGFVSTQSAPSPLVLAPVLGSAAMSPSPSPSPSLLPYDSLSQRKNSIRRNSSYSKFLPESVLAENDNYEYQLGPPPTWSPPPPMLDTLHEEDEIEVVPAAIPITISAVVEESDVDISTYNTPMVEIAEPVVAAPETVETASYDEPAYTTLPEIHVEPAPETSSVLTNMEQITQSSEPVVPIEDVATPIEPELEHLPMLPPPLSPSLHLASVPAFDLPPPPAPMVMSFEPEVVEDHHYSPADEMDAEESKPVPLSPAPAAVALPPSDYTFFAAPVVEEDNNGDEMPSVTPDRFSLLSQIRTGVSLKASGTLSNDRSSVGSLSSLSSSSDTDLTVHDRHMHKAIAARRMAFEDSDDEEEEDWE